MMSILIPVEWDGEAFAPAHGFGRYADQHFVIGERYVMEPVEDRSAKSHRQFFAAIREAWMNLPEHLAETIPSPEALRKRALIMTGYRDETSIVCASAAEARRVAAFVRPTDEFAIVSINGPVVVRWTAKSQSTRAMDRATFQQSKASVLDWIADLIGSTAGQVQREAGRAA